MSFRDALSLTFLSPGCIKHISWAVKWASGIISHLINRREDWQEGQIIGDSLHPHYSCTGRKEAPCRWNISFTLMQISESWRISEVINLRFFVSCAVSFPRLIARPKKAILVKEESHYLYFHYWTKTLRFLSHVGNKSSWLCLSKCCRQFSSRTFWSCTSLREESDHSRIKSQHYTLLKVQVKYLTFHKTEWNGWKRTIRVSKMCVGQHLPWLCERKCPDRIIWYCNVKQIT